MHKGRAIFARSYIFFFCVMMAHFVNAMTISGPIIASSVTASGDVTMSSMTVSTMSVAALIRVLGKTNGISGSVLQMEFSSSTVTTTVSTSTWTAVADISQSIMLSNSNNTLHISLSGMLSTTQGTTPAYITIFRDLTNLGDVSAGLSTAQGVITDLVRASVEITFTDSPGDTNAHTYQAYIRTTNSLQQAAFPDAGCPGYLLLEEVSQ